jgi:hypothetical protein
MICFGDVARQIIGKPVQQLLRIVTTGGPLPVDIAKIISRRFTFAVTLTQQSYYRQDRTYQVTSVVTAHGQHEPAPPVAQHGPPPSVDQRSATAPTTSNIVHNTLTVVPADEVVLPSLSGTGGENSLALLASVSYLLPLALLWLVSIGLCSYMSDQSSICLFCSPDSTSECPC